ncbi:unnamed protein product [Ixodes persulcatus]
MECIELSGKFSCVSFEAKYEEVPTLHLHTQDFSCHPRFKSFRVFELARVPYTSIIRLCVAFRNDRAFTFTCIVFKFACFLFTKLFIAMSSCSGSSRRLRRPVLFVYEVAKVVAAYLSTEKDCFRNT